MALDRLSWIAIDWGTSRLRVWAMDGADRVLQTAQSDRGMGQLAPDEFEPALLDLIGAWMDGPISAVACGMVGSRQGWVEAPYRTAPCVPDAGGLVQAPTDDPRLVVHIVPGVRQDSPADVMRGEETQIAGFLAMHPGWDGVICLPGTHTKWAHVSAGEIVSFQTVMTGEIYAALTQHTVLRHSVGDGWDGAAFDAAVAEAMSHPERLSARLFSIRAEGLLHGLSPDAARARLSGLLIGMDLAGARPYWLGQNLAILGQSGISGRYRDALAQQAAPATMIDAEDATLAGLSAIHKHLRTRQ